MLIVEHVDGNGSLSFASQIGQKNKEISVMDANFGDVPKYVIFLLPLGKSNYRGLRWTPIVRQPEPLVKV